MVRVDEPKESQPWREDVRYAVEALRRIPGIKHSGAPLEEVFVDGGLEMFETALLRVTVYWNGDLLMREACNPQIQGDAVRAELHMVDRIRLALRWMRESE